MIVVILAGTLQEAEGHARLAGLAMRDVVIPRSSEALEGLTLGVADLVVELPSFRSLPREKRDEIEAVVLAKILRSPIGERAKWHRVVG